MAAQIRAGWLAVRPHLATGIVTFLLIVGALLVVTEEVLDDALAVELGFSARQLSWLFALIYLTSAAASHRSADLRGWFGHSRLFLALAMLAGLSLVLSPAAGMVVGGGLVVFRYAVRAVWENIRSDLLNRRLDSVGRATALSTFTMLERTPYVLGAVAVGGAIESQGAAGFAVPLGAVLLLTCLAGLGLAKACS